MSHSSMLKTRRKNQARKKQLRRAAKQTKHDKNAVARKAAR